MGARTGLAGCFLLTLLVAAPASAATITVTATSDDLTKNDGGCSLREAIATVNNGTGNGDCTAADSGGNTIQLGAHTYPLTLSTLLLGPPGTGCVTGATGSDTTDNSRDELSVAGSVQNLTIDGAGVGQTIIDACKLADRALEVKSGASVTIKDLTITNGHARGGRAGTSPSTYDTVAGPGNPGANGGGILNEGTLTLVDSAVTNSHAGAGGAGGLGDLQADSGGLGGTGGNGGGIFSNGTLTLTGTTISGNSAGAGGAGGAGSQGDRGVSHPNGGSGGSGGNGGGGGGVANIAGTATITNSTIAGNQSGAGGTAQPGRDADLTGVSGTGGNGGSGGSGGNAGGIATAGSSGALQTTNDTIEGNSTGGGTDGKAAGAGVGGDDGAPGNGGNGGYGGGVVNVQSTTQLLNLTVAANSVGSGGSGGPASNTHGAGTAGSAGHGGGIYATLSSPTIQNTILTGNQPGGDCRTASSITDGGYNLIFSPPSIGPFVPDPCHFTSGTSISVDPMLDPLADNGGPTQTMRLQPGSPAIDQVPSSVGFCPATDQRGVARPAGAACDIGAYEVAAPAAATGPASQIEATSATISANVIPNAADATVHFEFGTDTTYGSTTPDQDVSGTGSVALSAQLVALKPNTTYHYQVIATSIDGTTTGGDRTFQTPAFTSSTLLIQGLKVKPKRVHRKRGAKVIYTNLGASSIHFVLSRCTRFVKGHCKHYRRVRSFTRHDPSGPNHFRLRTKRLKLGRYQLAATPALNGANGATTRVNFRIVR